jgi:hypothetical protein
MNFIDIAFGELKRFRKSNINNEPETEAPNDLQDFGDKFLSSILELLVTIRY